MPTNILINGAFGRMGQATVKAISEHPGFNLVGQTGREYDLMKAIKDSQAQIVIDFTHPESVFTNTKTIIEANVHPVIGTTGLTMEQITTLRTLCDSKKLGGIIAPNFSLGAVLMMKYAKEIVKYMPHAEIIEMHHDGKADSPSGTAMLSAQLLADACKNVNQPVKPARETIPHARGATHQGIPIHAVRLPGFLAYEQIIFGSTGETLTLSHNSIDRQCFMPGVLLACEKVMQLNKLVYGLENIL